MERSKERSKIEYDGTSTLQKPHFVPISAFALNDSLPTSPATNVRTYSHDLRPETSKHPWQSGVSTRESTSLRLEPPTCWPVRPIHASSFSDGGVSSANTQENTTPLFTISSLRLRLRFGTVRRLMKRCLRPNGTSLGESRASEPVCRSSSEPPRCRRERIPTDAGAIGSLKREFNLRQM